VAIPQSKDPDDDPGAALGETLKDLRLEAGFTTREAVGSRLGYSKDSVGKAETGAHVPTIEMLLLMLDLYQAPDLVRKAVLRLHAFARKARGPIPEFIEKWFQHGRSSLARIRCMSRRSSTSARYTTWLVHPRSW
jgi:transcriptional regulator with XRE-family HTH domain